uniref:Apoptosis regulator ced-9 n=2 Tax=Caenorhabditis tropicalis TaxID=1561998 RepID=A0A1I7TMI2_9PELO
MATSINMENSQNSFRRRTMATSEIKELLSTKGVEPVDFGINNVSNAPSSSVTSTTRRLSIGERPQGDIYDWEEPRLDIKGFVVDYFTFRINKEGFDWYDAPALPEGVQKEHEMMRSLGTIFESKHLESLENFAEQLLAFPKITFSLYQEVVQTVGNAQSTPCPMSYGRLVGIIAFGGMVAAKMMESSELRGQVQNLLMYTSLFIKTRIRQSWKEHDRSWAGFMILGKQMKEDHERKEHGKELEGRFKTITSWSVGAVAVIGLALVGGRIVLNYR